MPRPELPPDVTPEEERVILEALERALAAGTTPPSAWALAGRAANLRQGTLQIRHQSDATGWARSAGRTFANRGTQPLMGRGDAK
ncbi:MAG: hypothetical protein WD770_00205 [Actinomycetota bacterium]